MWILRETSYKRILILSDENYDVETGGGYGSKTYLLTRNVKALGMPIQVHLKEKYTYGEYVMTVWDDNGNNEEYSVILTRT